MRPQLIVSHLLSKPSEHTISCAVSPCCATAAHVQMREHDMYELSVSASFKPKKISSSPMEHRPTFVKHVADEHIAADRNILVQVQV